MALDGLVVHALTCELQRLAGGKISKIHQPNEHDIVMLIRSQGENVRLLLSANPTYPRMHVANQQFVNPLEAPMFCMLLRKHCESGIIRSIEQKGRERIVHLTIQHRDELGDQALKTIVVELTGRHSNIILLDESGTIIDGIHHVTPAISSHRIVMPGSAYVAPPEQHKRDPFALAAEDVAAILAESLPEGETADQAARRLEQQLVRHIEGISPLIAREAVWRGSIQLRGRDHVAALIDSAAAEFIALIDPLKRGAFTPNIVTPESEASGSSGASGSTGASGTSRATGKAAFSVVRLMHLQGVSTQYDSVSSCLEAFYGDKAERDQVRQRTLDLSKLLHNERNKNIAKLQKLEETLEEASDAEQLRITGELLTASLHLADKGQTSIDVPNYYEEDAPIVTIRLDPQLTPAENAQRYFKRYTKLKNSVAFVREQMAAAREEIRYLEQVIQQLEGAGLEDIEEIREELIEQGYVRRRGRPPKRGKKNDRPKLTCYASSEGVPIYVGKNNTQNEYLTNRLAAPNDTWLHTKDIPGSHVVIRGQCGEETLLEAAMLAAYYSQARHSSQVPVDYTLVRHVRKPSGAKPGFVIYDKQKTLFVTPDEQRIQSMKSTVK